MPKKMGRMNMKQLMEKLVRQKIRRAELFEDVVVLNK